MATRGADDRAWAAEAKCIGKPADFFFPVERDPLTGLPVALPSGSDKPDLRGVQDAKAFCRGTQFEGDTECPVRIECLLWAINNNQWEGIYGGEVERDRRRFARRLRATAGFVRGLTPPTGPGEVGVSSSL